MGLITIITTFLTIRMFLAFMHQSVIDNIKQIAYIAYSNVFEDPDQIGFEFEDDYLINDENIAATLEFPTINASNEEYMEFCVMMIGLLVMLYCIYWLIKCLIRSGRLSFSRHDYNIDFFQRRQRENEKVTDFYTDLLHLSKFAFKTLQKDEVDKFVYEQFILGIADKDTRVRLVRLKERGKSFGFLFEVALRMEYIKSYKTKNNNEDEVISSLKQNISYFTEKHLNSNE